MGRTHWRLGYCQQCKRDGQRMLAHGICSPCYQGNWKREHQPGRMHRVDAELAKALEALTDEFNVGRAGPSGLRAQAIAHIRQARLLLGATTYPKRVRATSAAPEEAATPVGALQQQKEKV